MSRSNSGKRKTGPGFDPDKVAAQGRCPATGKLRWPSRSRAKRHLRDLRTSPYAVDGARLGTYLCRTCESYHVGHRPGQAPT